MKEALEKVTHDMGFACEGLREALNKAGSVEALVILELIRRTNEVRRDVEALLNAYLADADESKNRGREGKDELQT